jgi:hypothetical protein
VGKPAIVYAQRPDVTPETEISALACVYKFVLDCRARKEATRPGSSDDAKGSKHGSRQQHYTG